MAPPGPDATRIFTFAHRRAGASVTLVEAYFSVPEGLYRLKSSPSDPTTYARWAKDMAGDRGDGLPGRLPVPRALLGRKLWEAARAVREGHTGAEVDRALAATLPKGGGPPRHPAHELDLSRGRTLDAAGLAARPHRLQPLEHSQALPALERDWRAHGARARIVAGARRDSQLGHAVADWASQWGFEAIAELLLDATVWHAAHRDWDAARTFYEVVGPDLATGDADRARRARIVDLLLDFVTVHFSRRRVGPRP